MCVPRCAVLVLLVSVASCKRSPPVNDTAPPRPLLERYPIRPHVRWTEKRERDGVVTRRQREERWTKIIGRTPDTWDVETRDVDGDAEPFHARYSHLPEGLANVSVFDASNELPLVPPRVVLPIDARPGLEWGGEHRVGGKTSHRACRLVAYPSCPSSKEGIEERCTTRYADGRVVDVHNKWCGGIGQVGYESITRATGQEGVVRIWSEDLVDVK